MSDDKKILGDKSEPRVSINVLEFLKMIDGVKLSIRYFEENFKIGRSVAHGAISEMTRLQDSIKLAHWDSIVTKNKLKEVVHNFRMAKWDNRFKEVTGYEEEEN